MIDRASRIVWPLLGACACVCAGGCGPKVHTSPDYGDLNRRTFDGQKVWKEPVAVAPAGLDSEEAALIHKRYLVLIGGKDATKDRDEPTKVLLIEEPTHAKKR